MGTRGALVALFCVVTCGQFAQAAVIETDSISTTSEVAFPASSTDLINQGSPSFLSQTSSGFTNGFGSGGPSKLNDGSLGSGNNLPDTTISLTNWTTTFHLDTTSNTLGYFLSGINTIAAWPDNRVNQAYSVYYSTVASNPSQSDTPGLFTLLQSVNYLPNPGGSTNAASGTGGNSTLVSLAISGVSGVNAIQFRLADGTAGDTTGNLETVWRELDAFGIAVPEPASFVLFGLGAVGLFIAARSRRRKA